MLSITDVGRQFFKWPNNGQLLEHETSTSTNPIWIGNTLGVDSDFLEWIPEEIAWMNFFRVCFWIHRGVWYNWDVYLKEMEMVNVDVVCWVLGSSTNFSWFSGNPKHETAMIFHPLQVQFFFLKHKFSMHAPKDTENTETFPSGLNKTW